MLFGNSFSTSLENQEFSQGQDSMETAYFYQILRSQIIENEKCEYASLDNGNAGRLLPNQNNLQITFSSKQSNNNQAGKFEEEASNLAITEHQKQIKEVARPEQLFNYQDASTNCTTTTVITEKDQVQLINKDQLKDRVLKIISGQKSKSKVTKHTPINRLFDIQIRELEDKIQTTILESSKSIPEMISLSQSDKHISLKSNIFWSNYQSHTMAKRFRIPPMRYWLGQKIRHTKGDTILKFTRKALDQILIKPQDFCHFEAIQTSEATQAVTCGVLHLKAKAIVKMNDIGSAVLYLLATAPSRIEIRNGNLFISTCGKKHLKLNSNSPAYFLVNSHNFTQTLKVKVYLTS